jgi:hypothetical protein
MGDIFEVIGFKLPDEASYQQLAEIARQRGKPSTISRRNAIIQGYCWSILEGIEIWTILHESKEGIYFADCRPAFRNARSYEVASWEIIEFIEDGEALVSGRIQNIDLIFELQNFTELNEQVYNQPILTAHLSGLCSSVKILDKNSSSRIIPLSSAQTSQANNKYAENDYLLQGKILSLRELINPITQSEIIWLEIEIGGLQVELLVNREQCNDKLSEGIWISAKAWMQGHIICPKEQESK